jgi:hypothetical protein
MRVIKSRMRWAGHGARVGKERGVYRFLVRKPEVKSLLRRPRRRWRIILGWTFSKWDVGVWTGLEAGGEQL